MRDNTPLSRFWGAGSADWSPIEVTDWAGGRSEEHTSELQSQSNLVCRLLLEKKKNKNLRHSHINIKIIPLFQKSIRDTPQHNRTHRAHQRHLAIIHRHISDLINLDHVLAIN